jgi:hypothetical protein
MSYKAFLSYSHESDAGLAAALQYGLQQYAKRWNELRAIRVFLDKTGISPGQGLTSRIAGALDESEYFLLLASPSASNSDWVVKEELAYWLAKKSAKSLLIILVSGDIRWSRNDGDFDWKSTDALPKSLAGVFGEEPSYLDLRWTRTSEALTLANAQFRDAVADLASVLHEIPRDILDGEDVRQHKKATRFRRMALTAIGILAVVGGSIAMFAYKKNELAIGNEKIAAENAEKAKKEEENAAKSKNQADTELKMRQSLELARQASRADSVQKRIDLSIEAVQSSPTDTAVGVLRSTLEAIETARLEIGSDTDSQLKNNRSPMVVDALGRRIAVASRYGSATAVDLEHNSVFDICSGLEPFDNLFYSPNGRYLLTTQGSDLRVWDVQLRQQTGQSRVILDDRVDEYPNPNVQKITFLPDSSAFITRGQTRTLRMFSLPSGKEIAELPGTTGNNAVLFNPSRPAFLTYDATGPTDPSASMWTLRGKFLWRPDPIQFWWAAFYKKGDGLISSNTSTISGNENPEVYTWPIGKDGIPGELQTKRSTDFDLAEIADEPGETFLNTIDLHNSECKMETAAATRDVAICGGSSSAILYETSGSRRIGPLPAGPFGNRTVKPIFDGDGASAALDSGNLTVWEVKSRKVLWSQPGIEGPVVFSGDNKRVLALNGGGPLAFDARTGKSVYSSRPPSAFSSPLLYWYEKSILWTDREGRRLIARGVHDLCVWDMDTGRVLLHLNLSASDRQRIAQDREALKRYSPEQLVTFGRQALQGCRLTSSPDAK